MKTIIVFLFSVIYAMQLSGQDINWGNSMQRGHQVAVYIGADYGTVLGVRYGYNFGWKVPVMAGVDVSAPFGNPWFDDLKARFSVQSLILKSNHFGILIKPAMSMRRYNSKLAIIYNVGGEFTTAIGYYNSHWSLSAEANYDHTFATHIANYRLKDYNPGIQDGWYSSTGGNFKFGFNANAWFNKTGVSLRAGKVFGRNFEDNPTIPFYGDFAIMRRL